MTRYEFIQQAVLVTLPSYLLRTKEKHEPFSRSSYQVPLTRDEAHELCVQDARALAARVYGDDQ
jgi:hypothetical protein